MGVMDLFKKPSGWFKIIEICIGVVTLALAAHYDFLISFMPAQYGMEFDRSYLCIITTGGFLLLSFVFVIGYSVDKSYGKSPYQEMIANVLGAILNIATAACAIDAISRHDLTKSVEKSGLAYGILTLINGIMYGIDAFLAYRQNKA